MNRTQSAKGPRHVAIIMDGNGRWARKQGLPRTAGHKRGIEALRATVKNSIELSVPIVSVYTFSTENWKRPKAEVKFLMKLFEDLIDREVKDLHRNGVRVRFLGELGSLSDKLQKKISAAEEMTAGNTSLTLNIMMNYGAHQELISAFKALCRDVESGRVNPEAIDAHTVSGYLYTKDYPDPELLIRTGGEFRLSNFMLWQLSYAEIYVTDILWPDFDRNEYEKALHWFDSRDRRFGGLGDSV